MFKQALKLIKRYNTIILHRHSHPDGDAIGSQLGMYHLIRDNFPKKTVYMVGDDAARLPFLGLHFDELPDETFGDALCIILDCGASHMIFDDRYKLAAQTLRFDHHLYCEKIADLDVVDSTYESACGLVAMFAKTCRLKLSVSSATYLYMGMVTDSGRFSYDLVTSRTFELAAFLLSQPIDLNTLYYNLYSDDFETIIRKADNMHKIKFTEHNAAYIYTAREELPEGKDEARLTSSGLVSLMRDIRGVFVWANFTECDDGVHVELRSNRYNINPIAVKYGGGGHKKASGCTVPDKETAEKLLADLDALAETEAENV